MGRNTSRAGDSPRIGRTPSPVGAVGRPVVRLSSASHGGARRGSSMVSPGPPAGHEARPPGPESLPWWASARACTNRCASSSSSPPAPCMVGRAPPPGWPPWWPARPSASSPASAAEWGRLTSSTIPARARVYRGRRPCAGGRRPAPRRWLRWHPLLPRQPRAALQQIGQGEASGQRVEPLEALLGVRTGSAAATSMGDRVRLQHQQAAARPSQARAGPSARASCSGTRIFSPRLDPPVVHPVAGERTPPATAWARSFRGEGQVLTAPAQVLAVTEQVERHDHALGVPARAPRTPRGRP